MHWYLVHTKPRQEKCALQNLRQQGYLCYLPMLPVERVQQENLVRVDEPLFPRYLFIRLGVDNSAKSWAPIRSTRGVSRLVCFGSEPAKIDNNLIAFLQAQEISLQNKPEPLFKSGEKICITEGAFAGIEGIYQIAEGESRVMVLIELLSKPVVMRLSPTSLRKAN